MTDRRTPPGPRPTRIDPAVPASTLLRAVPGSAPGQDTGALPGNDAATTSTMRLRRRPDDGGARSGDVGVLEYRRFIDEAARAEFMRTAKPGPVTDTAYDLVAVILPEGARQLVIEAGDLIQVVTITTPPRLLTDALHFNTEETCRYFRGFDGFVGAALHVGPADAEPDRLLEITVWHSDAQLARVAATDHFREHVSRDAELALKLEVARYELVE